MSSLNDAVRKCKECDKPAVYILLDVARDLPEGRKKWIDQIPVCRSHIFGAGVYF